MNNDFSLLSQYQSKIFDEKGVAFIETIEQSTDKAEATFIKSLSLMEHNIPDFYAAIQKTTCEYCIFNSKNFESFTALHHFGTAFLNLANQNQTEIFYIDDISHQAGHTIFYTLTSDFHKYLKPHHSTLLSDFTGLLYDQRSIYGAFHGLFTYTTTLHSLDKAMKDKWFDTNIMEREILARIGFYYSKLEMDIASQRDDRILTKEGWLYYEMFYASFIAIKNEYYHITKVFDYSNQDYDFNFEKFELANK